MITASIILACLAILADAQMTRALVLIGKREGTDLRRFLIRMLGVNGGTYGVAVACCTVIVAVNVYSRQPKWGLVVGTLAVAALFGRAAWLNLKVLRRQPWRSS